MAINVWMIYKTFSLDQALSSLNEMIEAFELGPPYQYSDFLVYWIALWLLVNAFLSIPIFLLRRR